MLINLDLSLMQKHINRSVIVLISWVSYLYIQITFVESIYDFVCSFFFYNNRLISMLEFGKISLKFGTIYYVCIFIENRV